MFVEGKGVGGGGGRNNIYKGIQTANKLVLKHNILSIDKYDFCGDANY